MSNLAQRMQQYIKYVEHEPGVAVRGRLTRMVGLTLEAVGCFIPVGGRCLIQAGKQKPVEAEVVGFAGDKLYLMPVANAGGLHPGARVIPIRGRAKVPVGDSLLGRIMNGEGKPIDGLGNWEVDQCDIGSGIGLRKQIAFLVDHRDPFAR